MSETMEFDPQGRKIAHLEAQVEKQKQELKRVHDWLESYQSGNQDEKIKGFIGEIESLKEQLKTVEAKWDEEWVDRKALNASLLQSSLKERIDKAIWYCECFDETSILAREILSILRVKK